jgi:uncharacterized membrane protein YczE
MSSRAAPVRFVQLIAGLFGWGLAVALFIRAHLGLGPWDAFHYGIHVQTGMTVGMASILFGVLIVAAMLAQGVKPGIGTLLNMLLIGVFIDMLLPLIPDAGSLAVSAAYFTVGIALTGFCTGLYIGAGFGHGPRDGMMVVIAMRSGATIRRVRTLIEATVLLFGWVMGGPVGIGTIVIMLTIGHSVQWGLRLFGVLPAPAPAADGVAPRRWFRRAA